MPKYELVNRLKCSGVRWLHFEVFISVPSRSNLHFFISDIRARTDRQSARMSEIKNVGYTCMTKCNQLIPLPFKGLTVDL